MANSDLVCLMYLSLRQYADLVITVVIGSYHWICWRCVFVMQWPLYFSYRNKIFAAILQFVVMETG